MLAKEKIKELLGEEAWQVAQESMSIWIQENNLMLEREYMNLNAEHFREYCEERFKERDWG